MVAGVEAEEGEGVYQELVDLWQLVQPHTAPQIILQLPDAHGHLNPPPTGEVGGMGGGVGSTVGAWVYRGHHVVVPHLDLVDEVREPRFLHRCPNFREASQVFERVHIPVTNLPDTQNPTT